MNPVLLLTLFALVFPGSDEPTKIDVSQQIMQKMITKSVQPDYPAAAAASGITGPVVVAVTVGPKGAIADTKARCGNALLTPAAIDAVKQYEFRTVALEGKPAEVHGDIVVDFLPANAANAAVAQVTSQEALSHVASSTVPKYPSKASSSNVQGCVVVQLDVTSDGKVQKAKAVDGNPLLLKAAEQCVADWTYKPFTSGGNAHPVQTYAIVEFTLGKAK